LQNRFENLAQNKQDSEKSISETDEVFKPPPIIVGGIAKVILLTTLLDVAVKNKYNIKRLKQLTKSEVRVAIFKHLNAKKVPGYHLMTGRILWNYRNWV
jgi:hypothetical protein